MIGIPVENRKRGIDNKTRATILILDKRYFGAKNMGISKIELKKKLCELGINVEGNYIKRSDIQKVVCGTAPLAWKLDKSVELKYDGDVYPLVATTPNGQYRIVKVRGRSAYYVSHFIPKGQTVGIRIGYSPPSLRDAKMECETDFKKRGNESK